MKGLLWLACVAGIAYGAYWYAVRPDCGGRGAVACPPAELEEGLGVTLKAAEVCPGAGYLCVDARGRELARWPLDKGRLRVRVPLPEFASGAEAEALRAAAIEGMRAWDGHPFPLVFDTGRFTVRMWDIRVVWTQGLFNEAAAGLARPGWEANGKRVTFSMGGLAIVVPPSPIEALVMQGMPREIAVTLKDQIPGGDARPGGEAATLARVKAVASHEMGHALGLQHSDLESDIMFPVLSPDASRLRVSARDLRTVDALYALPNGSVLQ
jgi:hypothetical protein